MQPSLTNYNADTPKTLKHTIEEIEKNYITQILKENNGNISQAAKFLGLSRQNLQYRIKNFIYKYEMNLSPIAEKLVKYVKLNI